MNYFVGGGGGGGGGGDHHVSQLSVVLYPILSTHIPGIIMLSTVYPSLVHVFFLSSSPLSFF